MLEAGLVDSFSLDSVVLNALFNNGVISHEYTDYIYANSCRNLVSGMAEWNGGFARINDDNKLQVDVFSKAVSKTFYSGDLMSLDYSDETITFSKVKTSQKNKTYEKGDDSGYTLVINNQYISYGLSDESFEIYLGFIYDYYKGFTLTPMTFTLADPDFELQIGDRISVVDEEEGVTVTGNISKIVVTGNCSMEITCGGFGNVSQVNNYNPSSTSRISQSQSAAVNESSSTYTTAQKLQTGAAATFAVTDDNGLIVKNGSAQAVISPSVSGGKETVSIKPGQGFPILSLMGSGADGGEAHISAPYLMADLTPQRLYYNGGKSGHTVEVSGSAQGVITLHTDSNDLNIHWGGDAYQLRLSSAGLTISAGGKQLLALDVGGNFAIGAGDTVLRNSGGVLTFGGKAVLPGD